MVSTPQPHHSIETVISLIGWGHRDRAKVVACSSPVSLNPPGPSRTLLGADHTFCDGVKECVTGRSLCLAHFLTSARENTFQEPLAPHIFSLVLSHCLDQSALLAHEFNVSESFARGQANY